MERLKGSGYKTMWSTTCLPTMIATTFWMAPHQARRPCASLLEDFHPITSPSCAPEDPEVNIKPFFFVVLAACRSLIILKTPLEAFLPWPF